MSEDRKAWNSRLHHVAKRKTGKKPLPLSEVKERFNIITASLLGPPQPRKPLRKKSAGNQGWYKWAVDELWPTVKHECRICKAPIDEPAPIVFSHLLERGAYRRYARDARNVVIMCAEHHRQWHEERKERLLGDRALGTAWKKVFALEEELKAEAHGLRC